MTTTKEDIVTLTEAELKTLARNALLAAGKEMGDDGDHWPVIKNTITEIMLDWEKLDAERAVYAEIKKLLYSNLEDMESRLSDCTPEEREAAMPLLSELRDIYDAFFTDVTTEELYLSEDHDLFLDDIEAPLHVRRAEAILDTLFEEED